MANIKSAKKRIKVTERKTKENKKVRTSVRTDIQNVKSAVDSNSKDEAKTALATAIPAIDKAASRGVFNKKRAADKKSKLTKLVNNM